MILGELFRQSRQILAYLWPVGLLLIFTLVVFYVGRFTGKFQEQREIIRYLPQIVQDEVRIRDKEIAKLEEECIVLGEIVKFDKASMRLIQNMAVKIEDRSRGLINNNIPDMIGKTTIKKVEKAG